MKHTTKILTAIISMFIISQVLGLFLLSLAVKEVITSDIGSEVVYSNTSIGERPVVEGYGAIIYILIGVLIGTIILLLLAKYNKMTVWKVWYFLAAWMTMSVTLGVITGESLYYLAWGIAALLAILKIKYPHPILHNVTEILMYSGIALILSPILTVPITIVLLIIISAYDAYAVWTSKHMITLAEFTKKSNLFPGLSLSYTKKNNKTVILTGPPSREKQVGKHQIKAKTGILGGGDVVFPLLFAGSAFTYLIEQGFNKMQAISYSLLISLGAAIALMLLFYFAKKERFYPAMPFITAGTLAGYGVMLLLI